MYSPFFDKKGQPLSIDKIKYGHLSQLVECDEGHQIGRASCRERV